MTAFDRLVEHDAIARLCARDASLFTTCMAETLAIQERLGWTDLAHKALDLVPSLTDLSRAIRHEGITDVLLLGMGGSSLAPLVIGTVIGSAPGFPQLRVVDTTSPVHIHELLERLDPWTTCVIVSSKSGKTLETCALYAIVREWFTAQGLSPAEAGKRCLAITDVNSPLQKLCQGDHTRTILLGCPTVGGRYSALSVFGLAPAALIGVDLKMFVERAMVMEHACGAPAAANPAAHLAAWLMSMWESGRDKLVLACSPELRPFGSWLSQLLAESLGKNGSGIVPVIDYSAPPSAYCRADEAAVVLRWSDDTSPEIAAWTHKAAQSCPTYERVLDSPYDVGAEFVLWEYATALTGALAGINPFNEPDVAAAKRSTRELLHGTVTSALQAQAHDHGTLITAGGGLTLPLTSPLTRAEAIRAALSAAQQQDYLALLAFVPALEDRTAPLRETCKALSCALQLPVCLELGPRYLHSTGQLYKGGQNSGIFIIITGRDNIDIPVPGQPFTLAKLHRAEADGDLLALVQRGRRVLRLDLPDTSAQSLADLALDFVRAATEA